MSQRSRSERHAEEEAAPSLLTRRNALIGGGVAVLGLLGINQKKIREAFDPNLRMTQSLDRAKAYGEVVFDEQNGTPDRLFECWKILHPGASLPSMLRRDRAQFQNFVDHQMNLAAAAIGEIEKGKPGMTHVFAEGLTGEPGDWGKGGNDAIRDAGKIHQKMSDPDDRKEILNAIWKSVQRGEAKYLPILYAGGKIAAHCQQKGLPCMHGADAANQPKLTLKFHAELDKLVAGNDEVTDEAIDQFRRNAAEMVLEDETVRHEYIQAQMKEKVPAGGTGILLLGSSHFQAGANFEEPYLPLEKILASTPNTRTVVMQESHLAPLLVRPANGIVLGARNIDPDIVRLYVQEMRRRRDIAK